MKELSLNNCRLDQRYDIREQFRRGSYAEIYLARDILASTQSPHKDVVIKALNVFLQDDLDADLERTLVENFQNEAIALDRVRHPNIISRIGHGTARDLLGTVFHYLVLEYLPGGDLQNLVRNEKLPLQQALHYIEQICAGLGHAHQNGIIHRDIKPQNLLLSADRMTVKIADFGVARVELTDSPITRVGTNIYAPPEHSPMFAGQTGELGNARLTPAADIYSLAKSVYTLFSGEAPRAFANETIRSLPEAVKHTKWAADLERVLRRATLRDPGERQQSVEDFWNELAPVRDISAKHESGAAGLSFALPQPHVARGYTPVAPEEPRFESTSEAHISLPFASKTADDFSIHLRDDLGPNSIDHPVDLRTAPDLPDRSASNEADAASTKDGIKRRTLRGFIAFVVFIGLFTGILYGTATYMRGRGIFPAIHNPFRTQTAVANTDIYLRPSPNIDNDPLGLVTKNSKVRIVNSQNNWYQVDVVEQGRPRVGPLNATRGWLNGKYLDVDGN